MKKCSITIALFIATVTGNPIDSRTLPLISEVYVVNPTQWYIELDMNNGGIRTTYPCSTSAYRLTIASTKETYATKFYVNRDGIAVLTPASIIATPQMTPARLAATDTITIQDSSTAFPALWRFPIKPVLQGNSLYNDTKLSAAGACANPKTTDRVTIGVRGNPPGVYLNQFISEMSVPDGSHWAMELDFNYSGRFTAQTFPCTLSCYRMRLSNSAAIYQVKACFDTNRIAVLRPGDIGSGSSALPQITFPVTFQLLDTCWNEALLKGLYWDFKVDGPVDTNHTLIRRGTYTTLRTSMGTRTTYETRHTLLFVDNALSPVSPVYIYQMMQRSTYRPYPILPIITTCLYLSQTCMNQSITVTTDIDRNYLWFGFSTTPISTTDCIAQANFTGVSREFRYHDDLLTTTDTIRLPDPVGVERATVVPLVNPTRMFHYQRSPHRILFTAVLPKNVSTARIVIRSLKGTTIAALPIGPLSATGGTCSVEWDHQRRAPGVYIGVLVVNGSEAASDKIRIW